MRGFTSIIFGGVIGFIIGMTVKSTTCNSEIALKLANMMNSAMLQCTTEKVITPEQVHGIETIFHKHIEENFKGIKASHSGI